MPPPRFVGLLGSYERERQREEGGFLRLAISISLFPIDSGYFRTSNPRFQIDSIAFRTDSHDISHAHSEKRERDAKPRMIERNATTNKKKKGKH